jgi:hypothetical protein
MGQYFRYGQFYFGFGNSGIDDNEFDNMVKKFNLKFWGSVSEEQRAINDQISLENEGEIVAQYEDSKGNTIVFIVLPNRSHTYVCTKGDLEAGGFEKFKEMIATQMEGTKKLKSLLQNSITNHNNGNVVVPSTGANSITGSTFAMNYDIAIPRPRRRG